MTSTAASTVQFAAAARTLALEARRRGLLGPSFRSPPRLIGVDRSLRRHASGGVVAVRVKHRPWVAVAADMIEGVIAVNSLQSPAADRLRAELWESLGFGADVTEPVERPTHVARHVAPRVA